MKDLIKSGRYPRDDLTGREFGKLTILSWEGRNKYYNNYYLCKCNCGNLKIIRNDSIINRTTTSCGCYQKEISHITPLKHGLSRTSVYFSWRNMISRCYNPKNDSFKNYGRNGIAVCRRWRNSVENFYKDMGDKPNGKYSIDRVDNNQGYIPFNCRWATDKEQARNRKSNRLIHYNGETKCITDWAEELDIKITTLFSRLYQAEWSVEKAFTTKVHSYKKRGGKKYEESYKS